MPLSGYAPASFEYPPRGGALRFAVTGAALVAAVALLVADFSLPRLGIAPLSLVSILCIVATLGERWAVVAAVGVATSALLFARTFFASSGVAAFGFTASLIVAAIYAFAVLVVAAGRKVAERAAVGAYRAREDDVTSAILFQPILPRTAGWTFEGISVRRAGATGYYHVAQRDDGAVVFLADLCSEELPEAISLAALRVLCESTARDRSNPREALGRFNETLYELLPGRRLCTAWLGVFDDRGLVRYSSAGQPAALVRKSDGTLTQLAGGGVALGTVRDNRATLAETRLEGGDSLLLYSEDMASVLERRGLAIEDLFENLPRMRERVRPVERRGNATALLATCTLATPRAYGEIRATGLPHA